MEEPVTDINDILNKSREERSATKWEPSEGDVIEGIITKSGWYDGGEFAPSMWVLIKDMETGDSTRVYCPTVLKNQITDEAPKMGSGVAIRYEGKQPSASNPKRSYHDYTFALVPDKNGTIHQDHAYWHENGVYRGPVSQGATSGSANDEDGGWF